MSSNLECFLANVQKVIRDKGTAEIGGGVFNHVEFRELNNEIRYLQGRCERLENDNKLMQVALKRYIDDPMGLDTKTGIHAAYRHVTGT